MNGTGIEPPRYAFRRFWKFKLFRNQANPND